MAINRELEHNYGNSVHIISSPYYSSLLTQLSQKQTVQPRFNQIVGELYQGLIQTICDNESRTRNVSVPTRMTVIHPEQKLNAVVVEPEQRFVIASIARAGILPSQICFDKLNEILVPELVRQDHFFAGRRTNENQEVTGCEIFGAKIGGAISDSTLLIPDPMGATGQTLLTVLSHYKTTLNQSPQKTITLHLIVTPEYIEKVKAQAPETVIYTYRVDRGFSSEKAMSEKPGTFIAEEKGLNDKHYIVPGAGGIGELLNNSFD
jgi:uracil phosphoribosyltransferase